MKEYQNNQETILGISKPLSKMDSKEKEQIHLEIESKMEELEATGLSKEELLYGKSLAGKGVSLKEDPVFQFLKKSREAREMLCKDNLNVEKVLSIAMEQDLGQDMSQAGHATLPLKPSNELSSD